jgi:hypothetical protein
LRICFLFSDAALCLFCALIRAGVPKHDERRELGLSLGTARQKVLGFAPTASQYETSLGSTGISDIASTAMLTRIVIFAICIVATTARAQTGMNTGGCTVGPGFECKLVGAHDGSGPAERQWVRAIVLWRLDSSNRDDSHDTSRVRETTHRFQAASAAAQDSGRLFIGGANGSHMWSASITWGAMRRTRDTLFVLGRQFEIPPRDSALVVMVDGDDGVADRPPRLIGTAWIGAELDSGYWPKHWASGDTAFTIMPRRGNSILRDSLVTAPSVRSCLVGAP